MILYHILPKFFKVEIIKMCMERGKTTDFILKQFRRKSKRVINKDFFTEFFYLNRERRVVEFLKHDDILSIETFFKEFLPVEFRDFVSLKIFNDVEEEIWTWYYDNESLVFVIEVNWGFNKQEISVDVSIDNFIVTVINEDGKLVRDIDYVLLNDYLISFLSIQARTLAESFKLLSRKNRSNKNF